MWTPEKLPLILETSPLVFLISFQVGVAVEALEVSRQRCIELIFGASTPRRRAPNLAASPNGSGRNTLHIIWL